MLQSKFYRRSSRGAVLAAMLMAVALLFVAGLVRAQVVTKNALVEADVDNGTGIVTIFNPLVGGHNSSYSFPEKSFLTVLVNGQDFYTNNPDLQSQPGFPQPKQATGLLSGARVSLIADTVRAIWEPQGTAYQIIQDVYPVLFTVSDPNGVLQQSGQIVFRFSIHNNQNTSLFVQAQYLLDVDLSEPGNANDDAPITTRYGYMQSQWASFNSGNMPPYFIGAINPLSSGSFPGDILSEGYCNDSLAPAPMGLIPPSLFAFVDWREVVTNWTWGFPSSPIQFPQIGDEALLFQWPNGLADSGQTNVIGKFSYGSAMCGNMCFTAGGLRAMLVHPDRATWSGAPSNVYLPNHIPVEAIVWNGSPSNSALNVSVTQSVSNEQTGATNGPLQIVSPGPRGYTQGHQTTPSTILPGAAGSVEWEDTILQDPPNGLINCSSDSVYNICFSVSASGVGGTSCISGGNCCAFVVDCEGRDLLPPRFTAWKGTGVLNHCGNPETYTSSVYDSRTTDQGVDSIGYKVLPPGTPASVKVTIPTFSPCDHSDTIPITVKQLDTLHSFCVAFTYGDCAQNFSFDTLCLSSCPPPIIRDTLSPRIRLLKEFSWNNPSNDSSCSFRCSEWVVTDSVDRTGTGGLQRDGGLKSIIVDTTGNMSFNLVRAVTPGMKADTFTVCVQDTMQNGFIIVEATDSTGTNLPTWDTIQFCTVLDTSPPILHGTTSFDQGTDSWPISVRDTQVWDRGVYQVLLSAVTDCYPVLNPQITIDTLDSETYVIKPVSNCPGGIDFTVQIESPYASACYTVQAVDCAGNKNALQTSCNTPLLDDKCPNDTIVQLGPDSIAVIFADQHAGINYDGGIDSIWFSNIRNMSMLYKGVTSTPPHSIHEPKIGSFPNVYTRLDTVILFVTDSRDSLFDSICWNAVDSAGNSLCPNNALCWSVPLLKDTSPPLITVAPVSCENLSVTVADNRNSLDLGVDSAWLDPTQTSNFQAYARRDSGASSFTFPLTRLVDTGSARTQISVLDEYGRLYQQLQTHTTTVDISLYNQDLAMKGSGIVSGSVTAFPHQFKVPVYPISTDTFHLSSKGITQYQFTFHLAGSQKLAFVGTALAANTPAGWTSTVAPVPPAAGAWPGPFTVDGTGPALTDAELTDTLCYLVFVANSPTDVEEGSLIIDSDQCGAQVVYNGGTETTETSANYNVTLPAPTGRINGGSIVLADTCATILLSGTKPTYLAIEPIVPNPSLGKVSSVNVQYAVPDYGEPSGTFVRMELFDALGENIRTLVSDNRTQGNYSTPLDCTGLSNGIYFLRLEAHGEVRSQKVIVGK